jgi:Mg/Co/Ni transporter MgtE
MSSFIIAKNEKMLQSHLIIVRFLTMLVGAGGNAGNQASVGVIRGLAIGSIHDGNFKDTLKRELLMGLTLSLLLGVAGAIRAAVFLTPLTETLAITCSLVAIVFISVLLGAVLPLVMKFCRVDPGACLMTVDSVVSDAIPAYY